MTQLEFIQKLHQHQIELLKLSQYLEIAQLTEEEKNMPVSQPVADLCAKFDAATSAVAAEIAALVAKQNTLSPEDTAAFQAQIDKLTALGADPANPVPTV